MGGQKRMKVQCEKFMFPYVHSLSNSPTLQSKTNTSLRHADSKPGQMMIGIITMSSSNRWMTKIGVGRGRQQCPVVEHI